MATHDTTKDIIIKKTVKLLARRGYEGTSIREISLAVTIQPSVIYYYFKDKQSLLREVREYINTKLRDGISRLRADTATELLRKQLRFQIQNRELIVASLKYFMSVPQDFELSDGGYIPQRAYAHCRATIERGIREGVYISQNVDADAKTISHLINGFLIEYYQRPLSVAQTNTLANTISHFVQRALAGSIIGGGTEMSYNDGRDVNA
jgi:AcrR family transcriptional regulator